MLLEWLRRHDPGMEEELESYLFKRGRITELEHEEGKEEADTGTVDSGLGVGSLKE